MFVVKVLPVSLRQVKQWQIALTVSETEFVRRDSTNFEERFAGELIAKLAAHTLSCCHGGYSRSDSSVSFSPISRGLSEKEGVSLYPEGHRELKD